MAGAQEIAGSYVGRPAPRPGREDELSPPERKRYSNSKEAYPLEIRADGTFTHKTLTEGTWTLEGDVLSLTPQTFSGKTFDEQERECEEMGRQFRFAFVYEPFQLKLEGGLLVTVGTGLIATVYERE
jgi:hypothetical protein